MCDIGPKRTKKIQFNPKIFLFTPLFSLILYRGWGIEVGIAYNAYPQNIYCLKCLPAKFEILLQNCQFFQPKIRKIFLGINCANL